ncbi:MAG: hypothetical protein ABSG21_18650, partial [Spirochaetia bacterium]
MCGKTGRFRPVSRMRGAAKIFIPILGLISLIWFLIRVIPKPSRASYPCMRAAAPMASSFVAWLAAFPVFSLAFGKVRNKLRSKGFRVAGIAAFVLAASVGTAVANYGCAGAQYRNATLESPNSPMGAAQGIFPGRVVWVWNPDATNEALTNRPGDGWFLPQNNNQAEIDRMLSDGIRALSGKDTDAAAWDAIFTFHNAHKKGGNGSTGYVPGQ